MLVLSFRCRETDLLLFGEIAPCLVGDVGCGNVIKECRKVGKRKQGWGLSGDKILDLIARMRFIGVPKGAV